MKDVQDDKGVFRLSKLNPITAYDLTELDLLVHKHKVDFWTKPDTKQGIVIIAIGILCGINALVTCTIKTKWYRKTKFHISLGKEYHLRTRQLQIH